MIGQFVGPPVHRPNPDVWLADSIVCQQLAQNFFETDRGRDVNTARSG
jgi:hypothetical protein